MRHLIRGAVLAGLVCFGLGAVPAQAQTGQFYFGVGGGPTSFDTGITAVTANLDESSTGYKLFVGFNLAPNLALEMLYANLGDAKVSGNAGDLFIADGGLYQFLVNNAQIKFEGTLVGVGGVFSLPLGYYANLHGRLGIASWKIDATASGSGVPSSFFSKSGSDPYYGVGVGWNFAPTWTLSADYEHYDFDTESADFSSISLIKHF